MVAKELYDCRMQVSAVFAGQEIESSPAESYNLRPNASTMKAGPHWA